MVIQKETIKINKKNILISCPNEMNKDASHPKIFIDINNTSKCKYCNTNYNIK